MKHMLIFFAALTGLGMIMDGCVTIQQPIELGALGQDFEPS